MRSASFSTATPKPRAEGSSPSAPAKESRRSNRFFGFLLWEKMALNCGTRSVLRGVGALWAPFSADRAGRRDKSLLAQFWALFSHLASSVSTVSVWYIIKRASKSWSGFPHWTCSGKIDREKKSSFLVLQRSFCVMCFLQQMPNIFQKPFHCLRFHKLSAYFLLTAAEKFPVAVCSARDIQPVCITKI